MVPKVKNNFLMWPKIFVLGISLLGFCTFTKVADGAPLNTPEASREVDRAEASDSAPSKITIARVQSTAQKTVEEEAIQNKATGATPSTPPPPLPKSGGRVKKGRGLADSSSDNSEMRQGRGSAGIQSEDSLSEDSGSKGKPNKGKSSGNKGDSF